MTATSFAPSALFSHGALILSACVALVSCERLDSEMEIKETREISSYSPSPITFATSSQRFGDQGQEQAPGVPPNREELFSWVVPEGWTDVSNNGAGAGMRLIDLRFGPNQEGECFLSMIPGSAGGLEANLNRWRKQMGQPDYTPEQFATLPKKTLLGQEASYVDFEGDFTNVGSAEALKGYRLVGLIHQAPAFSLFVKMTGPKELVESNLAAFEQFANSITLKR